MFDSQYFKEYLNTLITLTVDNVWLLELSVCMFRSPSCKGKQVSVQNSSHYQRATCAVSISYIIYFDLFCTQIGSYLSLPLPCICNSPAFHQSIKVTRPSFFGGVPSYFEALWYPHLYFYRTSNT